MARGRERIVGGLDVRRITGESRPAERAHPFAEEIPNECTAKTLEKSYKGNDMVEFDSVDDMFESWDK